MNGQLPLNIPPRENFGEEDFFEAPSNAQALALIRLWPDWPHRVAVLHGPAGAGKSHLAAIFMRRAGAARIFLRELTRDNAPALAAHAALVIEEADSGPFDEAALFHLINLMVEQGHFLLILARRPPDAWGLATRDLLSRLRRAPAVEIAEPDDAFLRAILVKLFADRQLRVEANLIDYLVPRIERTFSAAQAIVETLDAEALARNRAVTRALAAECLAAECLARAGNADEEDDEH